MFEVRVVVLYANKLESVTVDGIEMNDISPIENKPIREWFTSSSGRDGWKGLIEEIREIVDDDSSTLNFEFQGPKESKQIFEEVLGAMGLSENADGLSVAEITRQNMEEAQKAERRGLLKKAFQLYVNAAEYGKSRDAQFIVANYYYDRYKGNESVIELSPELAISNAIEFYEMASNLEHTFAQYRLYQIFLEGDGVKVNIDEAIHYLIKAANNNHIESQRTLAEYYHRGIHIQEEQDKAIFWYREAGKLGDLESTLRLGNILDNMGSEYLEESIFWYEKAIDHGVLDAMYHLGEIYLKHFYDEEKRIKAVELFSRASVDGHGKSQLRLAECYENGIGTTENIKSALDWYERAAEHGILEAQLKCTSLKNADTANDTEFLKLLSWYKRAADFGDLNSQKVLGQYYEEGIKVTIDYKEALKWYEMAAKQGDAAMQLKCGDLFSHVNGTEFDGTKAFDYYKSASEQGNIQAHYKLGRCYQTGTGTLIDSFKAVEHLEIAAMEKHTEAMFFSGVCHLNGSGIGINMPKAIKYIIESADSGYIPAIEKLARLYAEGKGVPQDAKKAIELFKEVANCDDKEFADNIREACFIIGHYHEQFIDTSKRSRSLALISASMLIPVTNFVTLPAVLVGNKITKDIKYKNFIKTREGKEMLQYYLLGSNLGDTRCRSKVKAFKSFY